MNWLTRSELCTRYPQWASPAGIQYLARCGYVARRREQRRLRIKKTIGRQHRPSVVTEQREVWVYREDQYVRYWQAIDARDVVLAELRDENGYQD